MTTIHQLLKFILTIVSGLIIFTAMILSVGRLFTPYFNQHLPDFEIWAQNELHIPVTIQNVRLAWYFYEPELMFDKVKILDKTTHQPKINVEHIRINFALFNSLIHLKPIPERVKISGAHITVKENTDGQLDLAGFYRFSITDNLSGYSLQTKEIADWLFSIHELSLEKIDVNVITHKIASRIDIKKILLLNNLYHHMLQGQLNLPEQYPEKIYFNIDWKGDVNDFPHIRSDMYFYVVGFSLPKLLADRNWHDWSIKNGIGSAKVWLKWQDNQWQRVQTQFRLFDLSLYSSKLKQSVAIPGLSASLGWKQHQGQQVFAAEDVLIDLNNHLFPSNQFALTYSKDAQGILIPQSVALGYINLDYVKDVLLKSGLLNESQKNILLSLNPSGEIRNLSIKTDSVNLLQRGVITSLLENLMVNAKLKNLTIHNYGAFPGIKNLTADVSWQKNQGEFAIHTRRTEFTFPNVFENTLALEQLVAKIYLSKKNDGSWYLNSNAIQLNNPDLNADLSIKLNIPQTGSPKVDMTGNFTVHQANHIIRYLPLKAFDADLNRWLKAAFLSGQIEQGKAVLQGQLSDFPFDKGSVDTKIGNKEPGKFQVSGMIKNLDFKFAPDWPNVKGVAGELIFSGNSMTTRVNAGVINEVPLKKVIAEISNLGGAEPTLLKLNTIVESTLENGFNFLHHSPLENKIGKELSALQFKGPMNLQLNLLIPLAHPNTTKVDGVLQTENSQLTVPDWKLVFSELRGNIHFTENSINADKMTGKLMGEEAVLTLSTPQDSVGIQASIVGKLNANALTEWFNAPLNKIMSGNFNYRADLILMPSQTSKFSQVNIHSTLEGLNIAMPAILDKSAESQKNFLFTAYFKNNQPMKANLTYGDSLSAALNIKNEKQGLKILGGDIQIRDNGANASAAPAKASAFPARAADKLAANGLFLNAQLRQFDWEIWKKYLDQFAGVESNHVPDHAFSLPSNLIRGANLTIDDLQLWGQHLTPARLQMIKVSKGYQININSKNIVGSVYLPDKHPTNTIDARFEKLFLTADASINNKKPLNPKKLPVISVYANEFKYGNNNFGQLTLNFVPSGRGYYIRSLNMNSALFRLRTQGEWRMFNDGFNQTWLRGDISTNQLNNLLNQFGLSSGNLVTTHAATSFDLKWPDVPYRPKFADFSGNLYINLSSGRIIDLGTATDVKMGLGRMLNILSLDTLPRRLSLDFSDLFQRGYSFDYIRGNFIFKNGSAYTYDTLLDGPVARINLLGRIGLKSKNYELQMNVTPYVTSSLPVVATIVTLNPLAGVATWLADKIVSRGVSKVATYKYQINGSWDNPEWSKVH